MGESNSPSVAHVGFDISPLSRVKLKILTTRLNPLEDYRFFHHWFSGVKTV
jgi:hypothetical protein